ncbi:MAG: hypothetical protein ACRDTE_20460, partial [Pseudonocardiaceae bacterium]
VEGEPPFGLDDNTLALLRTVAEGGVRPPQQAGPLTALLMKMLRDDPAARPSMPDAVVALGTVAHGGGRSRAVRRAPPAPTPTAELPAIPAQETRSSQEARPRAMSAPLGAIAAQGPMPGSMPDNAVRQDDPVQQTPRQDDVGQRTATPAERAGTDRRPRSGRGGILLGTAACLLVVLLAVLALNNQSGRDRQAADGSGAPATTTSPPPVAAAPPPALPAPAELEQTVRTYYSLLPEDDREAWEFLGETERAKAGGFSGYLDFWNGIDDVRIRGPVQVQDNTVLVNLQFDPEEGRRTLERYQLTMSTAQDGRVLIESAVVVTSSSDDDRGDGSDRNGRGGRDNQADNRDRRDGDG